MMTKIQPLLVLENFLPYRLSVLSSRISTAIAASYEQRFDLTMPEWRVMATLGEYPGISASEVSDKTAMDKVAVSRAIQRLSKMGRISRTTHPADKRRAILRLTDAGLKVYAKVVPLARAYESMLINGLDAKEMESLSIILSKLADIQLNLEPEKS